LAGLRVVLLNIKLEKLRVYVHKAQNLGNNVHPELLKALREASGRQK
jgi:hypothetical protein